MRFNTPQTARFQISMRVRKMRRLTNAEASKFVRGWIETGESPANISIKVVIWESNMKREITEIDNSERGEKLRNVLRRALQSGRLIIKALGGAA